MKATMNPSQDIGHSQRLKTAADAKAALLAKFKPKATSIDPLFADRAAMRASELTEVRTLRAAAKAAVKQAAADTEEAALQAQAALDAETLVAKRGERKERKALSAADAKAKRDARYAARKARA